jgi:hypothetical protein
MVVGCRQGCSQQSHERATLSNSAQRMLPAPWNHETRNQRVRQCAFRIAPSEEDSSMNALIYLVGFVVVVGAVVAFLF